MKRFIRDLKNYKSYTLFAIKAGLKAEVSGSYLNWIWWVLEPFCFMVIYATVFGMIFETSEQDFPLFIFIGNAMWGFFSKSLAASVNLIRQNETIISKVYLPKYVLLLIEIGMNAFKLCLNFVIVIIMLALFQIKPTWNILYFIPIFIVMLLVTFGAGILLMHFGVYIEDLSYVISILLNMLMFFSGVFYSVETRLEYPLGKIAGTVNPMAFLMTSMRKAVMYGQCPDIIILIIWGVLGIILTYIGIKLLYKYENNYAKVM